jgi:phosphoribosyl-dephospho-CoA transferase
MALEPGVHDLLRVASCSALLWDDDGQGAVPDWAAAALGRVPFVVVRRPSPGPHGLPVGVRGIFRSQRAPAWLPRDAVGECITPRMLAAQSAWRQIDAFGAAVVSSPAVWVLSQVENILTRHGLAGCWGPGGSVGAELASGVKCTTASSDLDLLLYVAEIPLESDARKLQAELTGLPVRIDTLLETSLGGVALADVIGGADQVLLRTASGPRLLPLSDIVAACRV